MLKIKPWISDNYNSPNPKFGKILILGESHYGEPSKDDTNFTINVIEDVLTGRVCQGYRYFTMLGRLFNPDDRNDIFNNCAFANLIQEILEAPRVHPTYEQKNNSHIAFWAILKKTNPDKIIVTSSRAWNNWLPDDDDRGSKIDTITVDGRSSNVWHYEQKGVFKCQAIGIGHPAGRGFYSWRGVVNEFLAIKN